MQSFVAALFTATYVLASPTPLYTRGQAPEGNAHIEIAVNGSVYPPTVLTNNLPQNVKIDLINSWVAGDISLSAGGSDFGSSLDPSNNFTSSYVKAANFDFTQNWVGIAFTRPMSAHMAFSVTVTPSTANNNSVSNQLTIPLLGAPLSIPVPVVPGLALTFNPRIVGFINATTEISFTHSFDLIVPAGSTLLVPILHMENTIAVGFSETQTSMGSFQSTADDLSLNFELAFQPSFDISATLLGQQYTLGVFAKLPKIDVTVEQVANVGADCSSTSGVPLFNKLTKVTPSVGLEAGLTFDDKTYTPLDFSKPIVTKSTPSCLQFDATRAALVKPGFVVNITQNAADGTTTPATNDSDGSSSALRRLTFSSVIFAVTACAATALL